MSRISVSGLLHDIQSSFGFRNKLWLQSVETVPSGPLGLGTERLLSPFSSNANRSIATLKQLFEAEQVTLGGGVYEAPCHMQPVFSKLPLANSEYPIAEKLCPKHICPPITSRMTESDLDKVALALRNCLSS